jgi:hypothetical protein
MMSTVKSRVTDWASAVRESRDQSFYATLALVAVCLGVLFILMLSGCSGPTRGSAVDASLARESLKLMLEHWKKGEDPKALLSSSPAVTASDYEWAGGAKLLEYEIIDDGREEDTNLRVPVKITLAQPGQTKPVVKKASYVIATSPSVTVYRDIMRR